MKGIGGRDPILSGATLLLPVHCNADNVSGRSTSISSKLQARQDKMEELYRVQALLQKLQVRKLLQTVDMNLCCNKV